MSIFTDLLHTVDRCVYCLTDGSWPT